MSNRSVYISLSIAAACAAMFVAGGHPITMTAAVINLSLLAFPDKF